MRDEWLRRLSTFVVPIAALATTVCISLATSWISLQTLYNSREVAQAEASLKAWDLGAKIRGEAYEQALEAMQRAYAAAQRGEAGASAMNSELERMRLDYYRIEPLISASSKRDMIRAQRRKLEDFLMKIAAGPQPADRASVADSFEKLHEEMHHCLYNALFALTPEEQRDPILRRYGAEPEACEPTGLPN